MLCNLAQFVGVYHEKVTSDCSVSKTSGNLILDVYNKNSRLFSSQKRLYVSTIRRNADIATKVISTILIDVYISFALTSFTDILSKPISAQPRACDDRFSGDRGGGGGWGGGSRGCSKEIVMAVIGTYVQKWIEGLFLPPEGLATVACVFTSSIEETD